MLLVMMPSEKLVIRLWQPERAEHAASYDAPSSLAISLHKRCWAYEETSQALNDKF